MITEKDFLELINRSESETLDFKSTLYDFDKPDSRNQFIKDILCMANTPRETTAYIVFGIRWTAEKGHERLGIKSQIEETVLIEKLGVDRISPVPKISYQPIRYEDKDFGILIIPICDNGPFLPTKSFGEILVANQIYLRRGSMNVSANAQELKKIMVWFKNSCQQSTISFECETWSRFLNSVYRFEHGRKYVLICDEIHLDDATDLSGIGLAPWSAIIDFDPNSEDSGLLKAIRSTLESNRNVQIVVKGDRPKINPQNGTVWFFSRGLVGRQETLCSDSHKKWVQEYAKELDVQVQQIAASLNPSPVSVIIFWSSPSLRKHLGTIIDTINKCFGDSVSFITVTQESTNLGTLMSDYEIETLETKYRILSAGLKDFFQILPSKHSERFAIPCRTGEPYPLELRDRLWLEEELEIIHLDIGINEGESNDDFYRGAEIKWQDLHLNKDCQRDITERILRRVKDDLANRRTRRISLHHFPGAGGTTVARRILWDLHREYPCAVLHRSEPKITADKLSKLTSLTENSLLLLVDGKELAERTIDDLFGYANGRQIPVVILQVLRRFAEYETGDRQFWLPSELSTIEVDRFKNAYLNKANSKRNELEKLASSTNQRLKTAFYFGLQAFGKEFRGLEQYVNDRIMMLESDIQKKLLGFVAMAHHYAQQPLSIQSFAEEIRIPKTKKVDLDKVFPPCIFDLLIKEENNLCRTSHEIIAEEIIKQLMCTDPRTREQVWRQQLSDWGIRFAWFLRDKWSVPPNELLELARRTFVYRDNIELLGTELSVQKRYSHLIEEIPSPHGKGELLRELTKAFPEEAHFHAHLARFCGLNGNFVEAQKEIDEAIRIQEKDHVLHHMKGMIFRYEMRGQMDKNEVVGNILGLARKACEEFEKSRLFSPENEHGYISEIQTRLEVLDYACRIAGNPTCVVAYAPDADPFLRESLGQSEYLLQKIQDFRVMDKASYYEEQCRVKLDLLYGKHSDALQLLDNLLGRRDIALGPVRKQIVWTMHNRSEKNWSSMKPKEIERCVNLLEKNIEENRKDEESILQWLRVVRYLKEPYSLDRLLEKVGYWWSNTNSIEAVFYLYVLNTLLALEGSPFATSDALKAQDECRSMARFRKNSKRCIEWLREGKGIQSLCHQSQLENWGINFWDSSAESQLVRTEGRIASIDAPQQGKVEFGGGLLAFFVPALGDFHHGRDENRRVSMFLGFSYEGPRAWQVKSL